jgi:hypothetical protein
MSSTNWIAVGVIFAGIAGLFTLLKGRPRKDTHGAVSDQWVAQHRSDHTYD